MKIKRIALLSSPILLAAAAPIVLVSCGSPVDQKFVDKFYADIINKTNWTGNENEYASSIYDLATFRAVFKDQLPTDEELQLKGMTMSIENIIPYDELGISNYTIYLRDIKNGKTYFPTPSKVNEDSDKKEPIVSFSIGGFLKATQAVTDEFDIAYKLVKDTYPLTPEGINFFKTQNIETNISFDNINSPYYVGKLFTFNQITNFEVSSFEKISVDDSNKIVTFKIYLKKSGKTKGPGKLVTLSL